MAYFRIYLTANHQVVIVQMSECDEFDYNQNRFLSDNRFDTEDEAIAYLQENVSSLPKSVYNPYSQEYKGILD